jgi:hypothetical protein
MNTTKPLQLNDIMQAQNEDGSISPPLPNFEFASTINRGQNLGLPIQPDSARFLTENNEQHDEFDMPYNPAFP